MKFTKHALYAVAGFALSSVVMGSAVTSNAWAQARPAYLDPINLPAQPIGVEDLIAIQVYDAPELTRTARVLADGTIRLPMLKKAIAVRGLLPIEIEGAIVAEIKQEQLLVDPFVSVSVLEYHSRPINVSGAVKIPTVFQAVGNVNLLEAIAKAGGLAPEAGGEIIITKPSEGPAGATGDGRPNAESAQQTIRRVPVRALIEGTDPTANIKLTGGEEIRVPTVGTVVVSGNVRESGVFPVQESGSTTVLTAIAQAKGLGDFQPKLAYIFRPDEKGTRHEILVELKKIKERKSPDVVLFPKDLLYVPDNNRAKITQQTIQALVGVGSTVTTGLIVYRR